MVSHRGAIQVQGDDIDVDGGHTTSWARADPVTAKEGRLWLGELEQLCDKDQLAQRRRAFYKAKRFIVNAERMGGVTPEAQPHPFQDPRRTVPSARVDIEIRKGIAFVPEELAAG